MLYPVPVPLCRCYSTPHYQNEQTLRQQVTELEEERKADQERYAALEAETKTKLME